MHHANNAVIMQTEQLGCIEALEEELRSSRAKMAELESKTTEQDRVIAQLVGNNLEHLQDNMRLTAHITSSSDHMAQLEHRLGQVGSVLMGMIEGQMEGVSSEMSGLLGSEGLAASGNDRDDRVGDAVNVVAGALTEVLRRDSPMPRETGLITEMERKATEAGAGGGSMGIRRMSRRAGVVPTPMRRPVRIEWGQLS